MKKLLVLLVIGILCASFGIVALRHYQTRQKTNNAVQAAQERVNKERADAVVFLQAQNARLQDAYSALHIECERGASYYVSIPLSVQKKVSRPTCGPVLAR